MLNGMKALAKELHPSHSREQKVAEAEILADVARHYKVQFAGKPEIDSRLVLDGFANTRKPLCVEVWAHVGPVKGAQPHKVMRDCCKLLLVEKLLKKPCRKVIAFCDLQAYEFLKTSWQGRFAKEFGIEAYEAKISSKTRERLLKAQKRQYR